MFGKKDGDDAGGNGDRESVSSGLTMLHQAMLHTGTTLSESLEQGLAEVKASNAEGHTRIAGEISSMTKTLRQAKDLLPLSYPGPDTATADKVQRLALLVEGMQTAIEDVTRTVTASLPVPVPVPAAAADGGGQGAAAVGTVHDEAPLLNAVPEQRTDSAAPPASAASAPADNAKPAAAEAEAGPENEAEAETEPEAETGPEVPLTRDQVTDAVREVLTPLITTLSTATADETLPAVAELGEQIAALRAEVAGLAERLPAAQQEETVEVERPVPDPGHSKVLTQAAGISSAVLVCHRDLWELLSGWAGGHPHFRMPPHIADQGENRIAADISGRSLIAVLISLATLRHTATEGDGDGELAGAVYQRISDSLASLSPDNGPLVTITLDDRSPHSIGGDSAEGHAAS
ncbi:MULTISPECIES: hypothetical protein [unclassified Streptomyces]|uniref:hypothetical protein n=1 Tax=unclassified Streptomyces TaxID=2593676 RepID=UPI00380A111C